MTINLSKGMWRLWLFFTLVWVAACFWQVHCARYEVKKAHDLEIYYTHAVSESWRYQFREEITPIVSAHLKEQVQSNKKIIEEQTLRDEKFTKLSWIVPAITLIFAWGIPWVWEGFVE